jgi:hypothetical protein
MRDSRCHATVETIEKALAGNYRAEHLFALECSHVPRLLQTQMHQPGGLGDEWSSAAGRAYFSRT